mmetsp:Transcript_27793/g.57719  ORF Transcript_27793/g.57719 Transcript_27793/m.57719 type:complete len:201 (-) Transcript_27793:23-625(-)
MEAGSSRAAAADSSTMPPWTMAFRLLATRRMPGLSAIAGVSPGAREATSASPVRATARRSQTSAQPMARHASPTQRLRKSEGSAGSSSTHPTPLGLQLQKVRCYLSELIKGLVERCQLFIGSLDKIPCRSARDTEPVATDYGLPDSSKRQCFGCADGNPGLISIPPPSCPYLATACALLAALLPVRALLLTKSQAPHFVR